MLHWSPTRGVCRASLQVSLPSAEVPHPHAQPSEWTSLDPEGQNESVFISPVIESSTSTSPAAVCDSWCRLQMVFLILGIGLQAAALPLLLLLLNAPQILFVSPYVQKKKKKGCTDAGWLAGRLALLSADPNFYDSLFIECEITVPVAAAQVGRKWSRGVFFGLWNPATCCRPHLVSLHYASCDTYLFIHLFIFRPWLAAT